MEREDFYKLFAQCMDLVEQVPFEQRPKLLDVAEQLLRCADGSRQLAPQNAPTSSSRH